MVSDGDPVRASLADEVAAARAAPRHGVITVVAPSVLAAGAARRALASREAPTGNGAAHVGAAADVVCVAVDELVSRLAEPGLADRDLRVAPACVDRAALRLAATGAAPWLGDLAAQARGLLVLGDACRELRRCPRPTLRALARRPGRVGELAELVVGVGAHLRAHGFADEVAVGDAAVAAVAGTGPGRAHDVVGPVVCMALGPLTPTQRRVLSLLAAGGGMRTVPAPGVSAFTEVRACADPDDEMRTAVGTVLGAARGGAPAQAVLHPEGSGYGRIAHQQLAAAGVAAWGPGLGGLDASVAAKALLGLLDLPASGWGRAEVVAWMSAAPVVRRPDPMPVPVGRWDVVSAEAGVVRGVAQWSQRLHTLAADRPALADDADALAVFVAGLADDATAPGGSWAAHVGWALGLLDRYLDEDASWPATERAAAAQVRAEVLALSELDRVAGPPGPGEFRTAVGDALAETRPDPTPLDDGVMVAPFSWARGLGLDVVVLVGLADSVVPGAPEDDALLPDEVRRLDVSGGLRTRRIRCEERHGDVRAAVAAGARRRVGTYPRTDPRTGAVLRRSRLVDRLTTVDTRWSAADPWGTEPTGAAEAAAAVSDGEAALRELERWAAGDAAPAPAAPTPRLAAALGALRARTSSDFTRFDGRLERGAVSLLSADAPVSATRLETYAKCPRRFLFDRVLGARPRTVPEDVWQMSPAERGTLVHAILEDYLRRVLAGSPRSLDLLLAVADEQCDAAEAQGLVGKALLWRMDRAAIGRELRRFYQEEGDLKPLAAELEFGAAPDGAEDASAAVDGDGATPPVEVDLRGGRRVRFKGRADRVDRAPEGGLVVSDYKTGRQYVLADLRRDPVAGGRLLQLPVYAMAARARFGGEGPVLARYWLLSEQRAAPSYDLVVTDAVQARFTEVVGLIADGVEAGAFPGAPTDRPGERQFESCRSCDFDRVCPAGRDRQWARKIADPALTPVVTLMHSAAPDDLTGAVVGRFPGT